MGAGACSSARVLHLIRQAQVVDELLQGSQRIEAAVTERVATFVRNELERLHGRETPVTACESLLCDTVIEALIEVHPSIAGCQRPAEARKHERTETPVAATLKSLVFGMTASKESFVRLMCSQTYEKAGIALRACVLMLEDAVRPQTCLRILALASSTGNQRLLATSAAVALLHFRQAFMQDQAGLLMLPKEVLGILLSHDCLQAGEGDIFSALGLWVMADEGERLQHLYPLTAQCVRLLSMAMKELSSVDQHPLTPKCPSTLKLVAFGYLCACYGSSLPEEYAPITGRSRRQRIAINPAALSLFSYDGGRSRSPEGQLQVHTDLIRLWPAPQGKREEASPAPHATLQQLREGLSGRRSGPAVAACSAEGLTYGVCRLLSTQGKLLAGGSSRSPPGEHEHSLPSPSQGQRASQHFGISTHGTAQEHFCLLDEARWSTAVAPTQPQRQPSSVSHAGSSSMLPEAPHDSMDHDAASGRAHASAPCSAAECAAASEGGLSGIQAEASSMDIDVFNTSPCNSRRHTHIERRQAEAQSAACRQLLGAGKPRPDAGLQRRLF